MYGAPEAPEPGTEGEPLVPEETFTTLEQAESAFARAERELVGLQGAPPAATAGAPAAAPTTPPAQAPPAPAPPPPAAEASASRAEAEADEKPAEETPPACPALCRAFSSLVRAADAVCRLSGEGGDRCTRARVSVRTHFQRVAACRCKLGG